MTLLSWIAVAVIFVTIWALIKRWETRLVLIAAGLFLCIISLNPMMGLNQFAKSMTNNSLIMAICGTMGFAFTATYTQCDRSLVHYLAAPIRGMGLFLVPVSTVITFFVNIAIPSAAGCAAAVGSTLIPLMLRAGIKPAAAAAAVLAGTIGSYLSPGTSHNPFVAKMAGMDVMEFIGTHTYYSLMCGAILVVGTAVVCFLMGDERRLHAESSQGSRAARSDHDSGRRQYVGSRHQDGRGSGYVDRCHLRPGCFSEQSAGILKEVL